MKIHDVKLNESFDKLAHIDPETGVEFWYARDLVKPLGYARWQRFLDVIKKAMKSCETAESAGNDHVPDARKMIKPDDNGKLNKKSKTGSNTREDWLPDIGKPKKPTNRAKTSKAASQAVSDHFTEVGKLIKAAKGAKREVQDFKLTRYACYLICQNGDPSKEAIALAQRYFAQQTRKQEILERDQEALDRLNERKKLSKSESEFSRVVTAVTGDGKANGRVRSKGDGKLFGGHNTREMKKRLGVKPRAPLADKLDKAVIAGKNFAAIVTVHNIKAKRLGDEKSITDQHVASNGDVREILLKNGIIPEDMAPAPDCKKEERRLNKKQKQIEAKAKSQQAIG